ncbi:MAG: AmmeMemoRadiSam system radical SAM enzyme [Nitrospinaceae bacterium]|nr:AmmeMemoRadiSam system radical SAM enzyme [Nitrospina sp.]MBT5869752.1 AmmeMemoRadiSam system radical SAM enzyme [Nitrospinaceae bacterium]
MPSKTTPLDGLTRPGDLVESLDGKNLLCTACGHLCQLKPGQRGVCKVRFNSDGTLMVPFRYSAGLQNDPIEKKPFFHVLPGSLALSFGMLGCDFRCAYCQNWLTSQSLKDEASTLRTVPATAGEICDRAQRHGSKMVVSTYNEPLITSEWAVEVFQEAKARGLGTAYVSNGHGTPQVLDYLHPWIDAIKIDLKSFSEKEYHRLGGNLSAVLETIQSVQARGIWLELVTLLIPGYNDSDSEISAMAEFIASVAPSIPWHVTAFHPNYKMKDRERTPAATLLRAVRHGKKAGLQFVYSGNLPGQVDNNENTYCPNCQYLLVERRGFQILSFALQGEACPSCNSTLPGRWTDLRLIKK